MSKQQEMHYKETSPENTSDKLKSILKELKIEIVEEWLPVSSIGTYSLRVTIKDTEMGANGKGVSRNLAMASAYAEFFERYQNLLFDMSCICSDNSLGFRHYEDEKIMSSLEIAELNNAFMNCFFSWRGLADASVLEKKSSLSALDQGERYIVGEKNAYEVRPYYNVTKKYVEYLPTMLGYIHYGSNGMCAGNSPEEAIIQGLSEIFERYVQRKMMEDKLCFPDVPEDVIATYPSVYEMYKKTKSIPGYYVALKDCSMGGQFPVAALVLTQKNSMKMGIKFGSHPDFGIAMERTFTEASQGVDIDQYATGSVVDFYNFGVNDEINIYNSFKFGIAAYPYQIFSEKADFEYTSIEDISKMNNKEILKKMIALVEKKGYEIWIRDVSYLGFPSYHIVIPGMSEMYKVNDTYLRAINTKFFLAKYINQPQLIDEKICRYMVGMLELFSVSLIENTMRNLYTYSVNHQFPGEEIGLGWLYLSAMGYAFLGEYDAAALRMARFTALEKAYDQNGNSQITPERKAFYFAVHQYCCLRDNVASHKEAMEYMNTLLSKEIAMQIDDLFSDQSKILIKQYPNHDYNDKDNCMKKGCCNYHAMLKYTEIFKQKQVEKPMNQIALRTLFNELNPKTT
jgi:ribosomal protein S12 methylthiotransferase accessory factor